MFDPQIYPLIVMAIGIAIVIGMIMVLRVNAFIALLTAAIAVSFLTLEPIKTSDSQTGAITESDSPESEENTAEGKSSDAEIVGYRLAPDAMSRVTAKFGDACSGIAIVIALAAVIGTCMMDSGAADRIVCSFMNLLGAKRAPWALMGSGYVLAVPVFFDTVFYLLVPLARSFYRRTKGSYLKCILAISAGGAITHTLVPPTPGPLTMAAELNIDLGKMILVGALVALPAAIGGIICAGVLQRMFDIPMREVAGREEPEPLPDDKLPSLAWSLTPVILPVMMIACHTAALSLSENVKGDWGEFGTAAAQYTGVFGNPSFALLVSTAIAIFVYIKQRGASKDDVAKLVEISLMSGGVIILITAAGSSFGGMLQIAGVGDSIDAIAREKLGGIDPGLVMLLMGFGLASILKIAQGSSTAAMIVVSGMMAGIIKGTELPYDAVYLATAIGAGSLVGSWMNDSGFWIFAKMGGLTEAEALKTWTPLLAVLGMISMLATLVLVNVLPHPFG